MTDYGIKILNIDSEIQIDSTYKNYVLEKSGDMSLANVISSVISITNNPEPPIAMVRPTGSTIQSCGVWDLEYSSGNYTGIRFFGGVEYNNSAQDCPFDYKIFTVSTTKSNETYGLRIYDGSEDLVYDSGYTPFKILEVGSATIGSTYTHSSHTSPFYVASPFRQRYLCFGGQPPTPIMAMRQGLAKQSTTSVKPVWTSLGFVGSNQNPIDANSGTTMTLIVCE
jgi:hypothetical protein